MDRLSSVPFSNSLLSGAMRSPGFGLPRRSGSRSFRKARNLSRNYSDVCMFQWVLKNLPTKLSPGWPLHIFSKTCVEDLWIDQRGEEDVRHLVDLRE